MKAEEILVALCDGHGETTSGKRTPKLPSLNNTVIKENVFNSAVVDLLNTELKRCGMKTLLVAPTNADTPLEDRVALANKKKATIYLSVHANSGSGVLNSNKGGIETYVYEGSKESEKLGELVHKQVIKGTVQRNRGVKKGNHLYVIRKTKMPSILVEYLFMDFEKEAVLMINKAYQKECAVETAKGICQFFGVDYVAETKKVSTATTKKATTTVKATTTTKAIGTLKVLASSLYTYTKANWDAKGKVVKKNEVFTVMKKIKVGNSYMYQLKSGLYVTANTKYVKYTKKQ